MSKEIFWLAATVMMTALFWLPYVLDRIAVRGLIGALANPADTDAPQSPWAQRAMRAHANAVENLVVFAALVLSVVVLELGSETTALACLGYFLARLAHFIVFAAGIPVLRTLTFAAGWAAQMVLLLVLFGGLS